MKSHCWIFIFLCTILSSHLYAHTHEDDCHVPQAGFFLGLGGSYNSTFLNRYFNGTGVSNIYLTGALVGTGIAGGPATPFHDLFSTFAPVAQTGYFQHFHHSNNLLGIKFLYKYLGSTSTENNIVSPQVGSFTTIGGGGETFTGHFVMGSAQTTIDHELALLLYLGRSFTKHTLYFGTGPSLFKVNTNFYQAIGFAYINGVVNDITGAANNFYNTQWMLGGFAQLGLIYHLDPLWFLDFCYTYAASGNYNLKNSASFSTITVTGAGNYNTIGNLFINTTQRIVVQDMTVSLNKVF